MNGARTTTSSLKEQIESAADRRDIELDAIDLISEDEEKRTFRVLETDADREADQVGFQVHYPGGPTGDSMFKRHLNNAIDNLQAHLNSEASDTDDTDDTDEELDELERLAEEHDPDQDREPLEDDSREARPTSPVVEQPGEITSRAQITVRFDDEQIEDIREMFEETSEAITDSHEDLEERLDDLDERISRLEEALGGLAQISADD